MDHFPVNVRQASLESVVVVRELFVVDAEKVEDRRVEVVRRRDVLDGTKAERVGLAVRRAASDSGAREPGREACLIVVASRAQLALLDFREGRAPELGAEDEERVVEEAASPEVGDQPCERSIDADGLAPVILFEVSVRVPGRLRERRAGPELHEADVALDESARQTRPNWDVSARSRP